MLIYLMRHGQTDYNVLQLCNDDPARGVHLTALGREQANAAADVLRHAPIEHIYVSELPRTRETAEIVNRHHGVPVTVSALLNDVRSGCDGLPARTYLEAIAGDPLHARVKGGETLLEHRERVSAFIESLRAQTARTVLVVGHEETVRAFTWYFHGLSERDWMGAGARNGEIIEYQLNAGAT